MLVLTKYIDSSAYFFCIFITSLYAARMSGSKLDAMEELDASSDGDSGIVATNLKAIKHWLLNHSQHLNFFTILVLASVSAMPIYMLYY